MKKYAIIFYVKLLLLYLLLWLKYLDLNGYIGILFSLKLI